MKPFDLPVSMTVPESRRSLVAIFVFPVRGRCQLRYEEDT